MRPGPIIDHFFGLRSTLLCLGGKGVSAIERASFVFFIDNSALIIA